MLIHWYDRNGTILLYDEPRPEPAPGQYLGTMEMTAEELHVLDEMIAEVKSSAEAEPKRPPVR
jgi:hypothetical protein